MKRLFTASINRSHKSSNLRLRNFDLANFACVALIFGLVVLFSFSSPNDIRLADRGESRYSMDEDIHPRNNDECQPMEITDFRELDFGHSVSFLPRPCIAVAPIYPVINEQLNSEGYVVIALRISSTGVPENLKVVESNGKHFENGALDAAAQFRFPLLIKDGEPVAHDKLWTFRFESSDN